MNRLSSKDLGNLDQLVLMHLQKKIMSKYVLPEGFKIFWRRGDETNFWDKAEIEKLDLSKLNIRLRQRKSGCYFFV